MEYIFKLETLFVKCYTSAISAEHDEKRNSQRHRCTAPSTGGSNYNIGQIKAGEFQFGVAQSDGSFMLIMVQANGRKQFTSKSCIFSS